MFYRHVLHECRHAVGSLVGSEVTVVSTACPCYPFLLVPVQGANSATHEHRLSRSERRTFWFCRFYSSQADVKRVRQRENTQQVCLDTRPKDSQNLTLVLCVINVTLIANCCQQLQEIKAH